VIRGTAMAELPVIENAFLFMEDGVIEAFGTMNEIPSVRVDQQIDASGRYVFPSFVDSHTHLVFAASREDEFVMKIKGMSYADIAAQGGGILNSAKKIKSISEDELFELSLRRAYEIIRTGTGSVEIKSGYGLAVQEELKMLRVARRIGRETPLTVKTTFLGAHAIPSGISKEHYINQVIHDMIPAVAEARLADYIDVFCEEGFFSKDETIRIAEAGKAYGLKPRLHANQLHRSGGVQAGVAVDALSVDHLENIGPDEIHALLTSTVIPTVLPGAAFFLNLPMPPVRDMINAGLPVALASDFNPGSSPSGNMPLMISLACIRMRMTPEEAFNAATFNTACALELQHSMGSITLGKKANVFITQPVPSVSWLPYAFGTQWIETVILDGKIIAPGLPV
jgi:imidazolonepropionase